MSINFSKMEEEVLDFWKKNKIFEKSVDKKAPKGDYVFYDGPPFATGLPHYGHILSSVIKDLVPRYWTMKGYKVRRRWGWDCHGLPIENIVEKELKISGKKEIEKLSVEKFNDTCRSKVLLYTKEWKKMVDRIGRWIEFDNAYKTMDSTYMESVWWALKTIWDKGLIYEGRKVLMYCPRCETPVSKAEVAMDESYKDITEDSVIVKFKVKNPEKHGLPENTYILAWTTTPWTLPANVALAIGKDISYLLLAIGGEENKYIVAKDRVVEVLEEKSYEVVREFKGKELVGLEYEPLIDIPSIKEIGKKAWYVTDADFVTTEEGTGIVHTAVVYGEDDYNLGLKKDLPVVPLLDEKGIFNSKAPDLIRGKYFKDSEKVIIDYLDKQKLLFSKHAHTHSYPHCWRCDTQLFYNAISAWFIDIQKIKKRLIKLNEKINWYPEHLKHGRFLNILETAPDWNISRNRYWATPLPFWKCAKCEHTFCVGGVDELKKHAVNFDEVYKSDKVEEMDLHKDKMDRIKLRCPKCKSEMSRIPEVIDCWVESASMPFAEFHYPFENKGVFEARFPGQYIAEYIAQTRAWFYYMHVMAVLLFDNISFENCVTTGTILNEKGEKLSKSKMNYTDPWVIITQYGSDALRYYLMTSVVMQADNLFFNDREVRDVYNKVINTLWNVYGFYDIYCQKTEISAPNFKKLSILDKWIVAKLQILTRDMAKSMDEYNTVNAGRLICAFINDLSTWWLRRSRDRFKGEESEKNAALYTLHFTLYTLSKLIAPFTPFIAEKIYQEIGGEKESVHLEGWPRVDKKLLDEKILREMDAARKIVELAHALRAEAQMKVRQPLSELRIKNYELGNEFTDLLKDELNVKEIKGVKDVTAGQGWVVKTETDLSLALCVQLTDELKKEGLVRELTRQINGLRKEKGLTINDQIEILFFTEDALIKQIIEEKNEEIKIAVLASDLKLMEKDGKSDNLTEVNIDGVKVWLGLKK